MKRNFCKVLLCFLQSAKKVAAKLYQLIEFYFVEKMIVVSTKHSKKKEKVSKSVFVKHHMELKSKDESFCGS